MINPKIDIIDERHLRPWQRTRCQASVGIVTERWRHHAGESNQCKMTAMFRLNGVSMCERHCGRQLIDLVLERQGND